MGGAWRWSASSGNLDGVVQAVTRPRGAYDDPALGGADIRDALVHDVLGNLVTASLSANTDAPRGLQRILDSRGLAIEARHDDGPLIQQCFDERGLLLERTETGDDGTRRLRRFVHDRTGRTTASSIDPNGEVLVHYEHDAFGRPFRTTTPNGTVVTTEHGPDDICSWSGSRATRATAPTGCCAARATPTTAGAV